MLGVSAVEFVADRLKLPLLELGHLEAAPTLGGADECSVHELEDGSLAKGMRDHLGPPPLFAEQSLERSFDWIGSSATVMPTSAP
jgi:hypothetical protein